MNALSGDAGQISKRFVEQHCGIIQQLYSQLNVLRKMKQDALCSIKPKSGSLSKFNCGIFRGKRCRIDGVGFGEAD
ncbi:hypothetical protein C4K38_0829 [Pseudomonas chlororaphis subsp. piscium]|nr:hypothetical protein C4K38_0829 [Pseudomonas chlororaphis subsp. piscium]